MGTYVRSIGEFRPGSRSLLIAAVIAAVSVLLGLLALNSAGAVEPSNEHFLRTWQRTDKPVADGDADRTWNWGTEAISNEISEPYAESPNGERRVQYYDKSRMEINNPDADPESIWYVTNGLLVVELMTGRMQIGDSEFQDRFPADVPVAGDQNDPNGVTYEVFADFRQTPPTPLDTVYTQRLHADGTLSNDASLAVHNVSAAHLDEVTNHAIAGPFWDFMNSSGPVYVDGEIIEERLFPNEYYSTGRPLTEFYWTRSLVGGTERDVGIQCFERRCLTFTPGNPPGFVVEAGNVGLHYFIWRYETPDPTPTPTATLPATATPTATATITPTATATVPDEVGVIVGATVNCDSAGSAEGAAQPVGEPGVCDDFIGGEIQTVQDGVSTEADEVQELGLNDATGGTFIIIFNHPDLGTPIIVTGINHDATAAQIAALLNNGFNTHGVAADTPTVEPESVDPDAGLNEADMRFIFENGDLAARNVPEMTVNNTPLIGETVAGTFSTITQGSSGQDELQVLTENLASDGTFQLSFQHPTAGLITTDPIIHNASAALVSSELNNAFGGQGVGSDSPSVSGGPANSSDLEFLFENGDLAGVNVPAMSVDSSDLEVEVFVSEVDVFDEASAPITTWQIEESGNATGMLEPGEYEFCFTYTEDNGQTDTECSGLVDVSPSSFAFTLTALLDY